MVSRVSTEPAGAWQFATRPRFILLLVLLLLAVADLIGRGPLDVGLAGDMAAPYVSSIRFLKSENPYAPQGFLATWYAAGAPAGATEASNRHPMYPPTTLSVVWPLAYLRWPSAVALYTWLSTLLYFGLVFCCARWVGQGWATVERMGFVAFALALSPIQTAIHLGNLSVLAFVLVGYAVVCAFERRDIAAGIFATLSLFVKPAVAIPILLFFLLSRRFKLILASLVSGLALGLFTAIRMLQINPAWKQDYHRNIALLFSPTSSASFANPGSARFDLLNLQVPLFSVFSSRTASNLIAWSIVSLLCVVWLWFFVRRSHESQNFGWAAVAAAGLLSLLPIYQRNYNAGFVLFALLWAFRQLDRPIAKWVMIFSIPFLLPGEAILRRVVWPRLPETFTHGLLWNAIIMPHLTWVVLILACLMLSAMAMEPRTRSASELGTAGFTARQPEGGTGNERILIHE